MSKVSPTIKAIDEERKRQEMSVPELADKTGVAFSTLYRIFAGETIPILETVEVLAGALKMKITVKKK